MFILLIGFLRQFVTILGELVPLEQFNQTRCPGMLIFLITFLRQPVTIIGEPVQHERFSQTSVIIASIKVLFVYSRFSR